jgi:hypothetical protein
MHTGKKGGEGSPLAPGEKGWEGGDVTCGDVGDASLLAAQGVIKPDGGDVGDVSLLAA